MIKNKSILQISVLILFVLILYMFVLLLIPGRPLFAQTANPPAPPAFFNDLEETVTVNEDTEEIHSPASSVGDQSLNNLYSSKELYRFIEIIVLCFVCLISLGLILFTLSKSKPAPEPMDILYISGLILIIFATVIIILVADAEQQLTASMGIIGSIAGYLFGSMKKSGPKPNEPIQVTKQTNS